MRTIIELVKNKVYYDTRYSESIGPLDEVLRETCNNYSFCELYQIVALGNVLNCNVQSVYPYIDYRAEMKIMNAIYKPIEQSMTNNSQLIICWSHCEDGISYEHILLTTDVGIQTILCHLLKHLKSIKQQLQKQINSTSDVINQSYTVHLN